MNNDMQTDVIILAAGKGKRMGSKDLPKVLFVVNGKPMIVRLIQEINLLENVRPIIVVGFMKELVIKSLGNNFEYVEQIEQRGTAHAVHSAKDIIVSKNVAVLYGDMPFIKHTSIQRLIQEHEKQENILTMFTTIVPNFEGIYETFKGFGRIVRSEDGRIQKIVEYADATEEEKNITEVNTGIYIFDSQWLWGVLPKIQNDNMQGEFYLTDTIGFAVSAGGKVEGISIEPKEVYGINTQEQLNQAHFLT